MKIKEILNVLEKELQKIEEPYFAKKEALLILSYFLKTSPLNVYLYLEKKIENKVQEKIFAILKKRLLYIPLAYLLKEAWFWGRKFLIDEGVLIPRQETEILVEAFLESNIKQGTFLELGIGSGVISISILLERPLLKAFGIDISKKAIEVCKKNRAYYKLEKRLNLLQGNWFSPFQKKPIFSAIISNPPYISKNEWEILPEEVKKEPFEALVAGETGLEFHEKLLKESHLFLKKGGFLFFEIGYNQKKRSRKSIKKI